MFQCGNTHRFPISYQMILILSQRIWSFLVFQRCQAAFAHEAFAQGKPPIIIIKTKVKRIKRKIIKLVKLLKVLQVLHC